MVKQKPKSYFTKGKGINREVHPITPPKGHRISHAKTVHPSRDEIHNAHMKRRVKRLKAQPHIRKPEKTYYFHTLEEAKEGHDTLVWLRYEPSKISKVTPKDIEANPFLSRYKYKIKVKGRPDTTRWRQ